MNTSELLDDLRAKGLFLAVEGADGLRVSPASRLTDDLRQLIRAHKRALLTALQGRDVRPREPLAFGVTIGGKTFSYTPRWSGERLSPADGYLALDTETELIPDDPAAPPPQLALASASAGDRDSCLVHPEDVGAFVLAHQGLRVVCHHAAFDFWVIEEHLRRRGEEEAREVWWTIADRGRLHDSMLLDALVRLARDDTAPVSRGLGVVAQEYAGVEVDKEDPYRRRYGEIIGADWSAVEPGFFTYAVKDAIATRLAHAELRRRAAALAVRRAGSDAWPDAAERFGLLTETVQVRKAIALAAIERNGIGVDRARARAGEADLRRRLDAAVAEVRAMCPELFKTAKDGSLKLTKTGAPSKSKRALLSRLGAVKEEVEAANGVTLNVPLTGKTKEPTTSTDFWAEYKDLHPFLAAWVEVEESAKLLQFFARLQGDRVHPRYAVLKRAGRTSCSSPNVQQIPREGPLRSAFVPAPGYFLLAADYSFIELRTLAAVCLRRYGRSALADVIGAGLDPHANTAALMTGVRPEWFLAWKGDPEKADRFKEARQMAKPVNFGVPGGLGADSLARYARRTYGVAMTAGEAQAHRERLIGEVYPELSDYLAEDAHAVLAGTLRTTVEEVRNELGDTHLTSVRKILEGDPKRRDGQPYSPPFVGRVWQALAEVNRNPELADELCGRAASKELARKVCMAGVVTLTGRVRGRVRYSQARNTPFQGLAADGAALALFALVKAGHRIVGFVHDEVLIELPDEGGSVAEAEVRRVEGILVREMEKVLGGVPAAVESSISRCWGKGAGLIVRGGRVYPGSPPDARAPRSPVN
jgi:DNA polymerase I-like protein with 3'-5' exonuclease and polymerase domains